MDSINFFGNTHVGKIRTNNEDTFVVRHIWDKNHVLAVVIDGVGGYEGGEIASATAVDSIVEYLEKYPNGERLHLLKQAVIHANNTIFDKRKKMPQYANMSCVLTAVLIEWEQKRINMCHVGDTRLYQYCCGKICKLSHDHSLVGYREEIGDLTEEEAMHHPQRNIIGRDIGSTFLEDRDENYVETASFPLEPDSILLLCSDGLNDMITSSQMENVLNQKISLKDKVQGLIDAAIQAGGKDNVTVILVEVNFTEDKQAQHVDQPAVSREKSAPDTPQECYTEMKGENPPSKCGKSHLFWILLPVTFILGGLIFSFGIRSHDQQQFKIKEDSLQNEINTLNSLKNEIDTLKSKNNFSSYYLYRSDSDVKREERWGYVNMQGDTVIILQRTDTNSFDDSHRAVVGNANSGKFGYIDSTGKVVIPLQYDTAEVKMNGDTMRIY